MHSRMAKTHNVCARAIFFGNPLTAREAPVRLLAGVWCSTESTRPAVSRLLFSRPCGGADTQVGLATCHRKAAEVRVQLPVGLPAIRLVADSFLPAHSLGC
jgi:hypothetical protein